MALLQFTSFEFWSHEEEDKRISKKTLEPALRNRSKVTIMRNLRMRFWDEKSRQIWKDNNMLWRDVYLPNLVVLPPREIKRRYIIVYRNWSSDMIYHRHRRRRHNPCLYFLELLWLCSCPIKPFFQLEAERDSARRLIRNYQLRLRGEPPGIPPPPPQINQTNKGSKIFH